MARNNLFPTSSKSILPKVIGYLVLFAVLALVVKHPGQAAGWVKHTFVWIGSVTDGLASFIQSAAS
jgi:hypothetical protein